MVNRRDDTPIYKSNKRFDEVILGEFNLNGYTVWRVRVCMSAIMMIIY